MNKSDRRVAEVVCRRFTSVNTNVFGESYDIREFVLRQEAFRNFGIAPDQITEILDMLVKDGYLIQLDKAEEGWKIKVRISKIEELYYKAIEGRKLSSEETRQRKFFEIALHELKKKDEQNSCYNRLKQAFEDGKWLRLCCASCGDFIQEIHSFDELKALEKQEIKCRRNDHKNTFEITQETIKFKSVDTNIFDLLKNPKVDK